MKILVVVFSIAIIMLPHLLQSLVSNTRGHVTVVNVVPPVTQIANAQNNTFASTTTNTGTGISAGATNVTTEGDVENTGNAAVPSPTKSQQIQESKIEQKKPVPVIWLASHSPSPRNQEPKVALVVPVFTGAAYNNAFYVFYKHYALAQPGKNITQHLYLLSSKLTDPKSPKMSVVSASSYAMRYLAKHLELLMPKNNISVLTDIDVDAGHPIFTNDKNTTNRYDILILGHQEYVTQQEYDNLRTFVANGGTIVLLDGNVFYAQVGYDRPTETVTLIKGHGWAFNGKSAWKSVGERWSGETSRWVGSNFFCFSCRTTFAYNPFGYTHREEQYISNPNATILLNYNASALSPNPKIAKNATSTHLHTVAAYELTYKRGKVIDLGIYSDEIIDRRAFLVLLDHIILSG
jgi:hypothetical protein